MPLVFRVLQCFRRYEHRPKQVWDSLTCKLWSVNRFRDTRQAFPHLVNALKYSTGIITIMFNAVAKYYEQQGELVWDWVLGRRCSLIATRTVVCCFRASYHLDCE
jgi:hypothetical protein